MKKFFYLLTLLLFVSTSLYSQEIIKIVSYNILNYPNNSFFRNPKFELIMDEIQPDIVVVQEISSQSGADQFQSDVLGSKFKAATFIESPDDERALFYRDSLIEFLSHTPISTTLRDINEFKLVHKFTLDTVLIYGVHLKASSGSDNEQRRLDEVTELRNVTDELTSNSYFIVMGDFNIYNSWEPAYQKLLDQTTPGYFLDPINRSGGWHNNSAFEDIHTQSTRTDNFGDGGATGGLDDRFDQILISASIKNTGGIDYVTGSYYAFGNDGNHFNQSINEGTNSAVSTDVADALHDVSDHLPVVASFDFGEPVYVKGENLQANEFRLMQNFPNPFNPSTNIVYSLPSQSIVSIKVYDLLGREIQSLVNGKKSAGNYKVEWNAQNVASGIYFYSIEAVPVTGGEIFRETKKMILVR
ncbi:MAG: T9SS type A sorting domain-containing protein [Melioribacteraceae bacterium]|nr:T9SS type A sorting domain-containing protein [Melioribacteraceae bacterium]MCF8353399.1 T9SS type A sorting domain-containing protein [Melioribacteraceae bacterium]MCF8393022.1 T9SS type A sorting domain-containing protein [Melioribacteraceae bacterium]MCF8419125.1 T9SS type A sorting domain-containing protein [Melioribacteraceae bacterium]